MSKSSVQKRVMTLVLIRNEDKILLGMKKRGFGKGKWNGFGGKVEPNETVIQGAIREVKEECGVDLTSNDLVKLGLIDFEFENDPIHLEGHIFEANNYSGEITESEEMEPRWFEISNMPYDKMWDSDQFWHSYFFQRQKFQSYFLYDNDDKILVHKMNTVDVL